MKKRLVIRKEKTVVKVTCGPFRGKLIQLLKSGFSGWHCRFVATGELGYVFRNEVQ